MDQDVVRIPVEPQVALVAIWAIAVAFGAVMMVRAALLPNAGAGTWLFATGLVFGAVFMLVAWARLAAGTWGKRLEIVLEGEALSIPEPGRGTVRVVQISEVLGAKFTRTRSAGFLVLSVQPEAGQSARDLNLSSMAYGDGALQDLLHHLAQRGVSVT